MTQDRSLPGALRASLATFEADLRVESAELDRLEETIAREREALSAGLSEDIAAIAAEKERHARALAQLAERRLATLEHEGTRLRMETWLERFGAGEPLRATWRDVRVKAERIDAANRANGRMIGAHLRAVQGRLAALASAADPARTYGPAAQAATGLAHSGRALGAA